jgi:hypothetical protein
MRLGYNAGKSIVVDNVAYKRKDGQPTPGDPDLVTPSFTNIDDLEFYYGDNNVAQPLGFHYEWTACENAIAFYTSNYVHVALPPWGSSQRTFTAVGLCRYWGHSISFYLNGSSLTSASSQWEARAVAVTIGDILTYTNRNYTGYDAYTGLLPSVY